MEPQADTTGPQAGHVILRDEKYFNITALEPSLDGPIVVGVNTVEGVEPHQIRLKASDLRKAGDLVGLTIWTY